MIDERRKLLETLEAKQRRYRRECKPFAVMPEPDLPGTQPEGEALHRPLPPSDLQKNKMEG